MQKSLDVIISILRNDHGVTADLGADTKISDVGIDSVDLIGFLFALEEKTGVKIPDEDLNSNHLQTLGQYARYVDDHSTPA